MQDRNSGRRGIVSVFDDGGRTRRISEIVRDRETIRKIDGFAEKIYITAKNGTQEALRWHAKNEDIREQLTKLYDGVNDGIANGVAIENGDTIYIIDSGKDNGKLSFGVRKRRIIKEPQLRAETVRRTNNDAVSKGYISDGLSSRLGDGYDNNRRRDLRRELGEELSSDTRKPENHQEGISNEVKYSRRITEGYNERSDEFRRIQETSRNLSDRELQSYRNGDKKVDAALRGRLSQVYRDAIHASGSRRGNGYDVVVKTEKFTVYKGIEASLFHDTLAPPS